jgi:nitrogen fixation NifU-like protein
MLPTLGTNVAETHPELYGAIVLEHYRRPRNREPLAVPDARQTADNPVCGDRVEVEIRREAGAIAEISARARGCSVVVASASVMTELVRGRTAAQVEAARGELDAILRGDPACDSTDPRLRAFAGLAPHASRHRCATLPWDALQAALA